jgi:hypothetical protein
MSRKSNISRTSGAVVLGLATVALSLPALVSTPAAAASTASSTVSPYAEPLEALNGRTLAQYVAAHHAADPRLRGF